jgi:hypothetical protein
MATNLNLKELDNLFCSQLTAENPKLLTVESLYLCGVSNNTGRAERVIKRLLDTGILTEEDPTVHTELIDRNFANRFYFVPIRQQKRLINTLFYWEEELMRWRLLDEEAADIKVVLDADTAEGRGSTADLELRLMQIETLKKLKPSARPRPGIQDELPSYG